MEAGEEVSDILEDYGDLNSPVREEEKDEEDEEE